MFNIVYMDIYNILPIIDSSDQFSTSTMIMSEDLLFKFQSYVLFLKKKKSSEADSLLMYFLARVIPLWFLDFW